MPRAFAPLLGPRLATALIFLVHASCVALLFRPVSGLWSAEPVIEQDWGTHYHHLLSLSAFWKEGGRLWGYDPAFMAGPPGNTIQDASVKLFELGALALGGGAPVRAFKLLAFLSAAALPWLVHAAARNLFEPEGVSAWVGPAAALLATASWWNSLPREMFFYGMIGFPAAAGVAVWSLSLARRAAARPRFSSAHAALPASLAVLLPLHVQGFAIFAGVGLCAGLLLLISSSLSPAEGTAEGRRGRAKGAPVTGGHAAAGRAAAERVGAGRAGAGRAAARREATGHEAIGRVAIGRVAIGRLVIVRLFLFVLVSMALAALVNLPWLGSFITHHGDDVSATLLREVHYFTSDNVWTFARDYATSDVFFTFRPGIREKGFRLALLVLGLLGLAKLLRRKALGSAAVLGSGVTLLFGLAYFGSLAPAVAAQQPLRFKVPLDFFLALASAYALLPGPGLGEAALRHGKASASAAPSLAGMGSGARRRHRVRAERGRHRTDRRATSPYAPAGPSAGDH